jgi:energy-coupling factor transporter ATP-binding protein EcfA2
MFTDHERLPEATFLSEIADRTGALVLPGLELNVFVDALGKSLDKVGKEVCFHLLVGFDPGSDQSPEYWCEELYRKCRKETRMLGDEPVVGVSKDIDEIRSILRESGGFLIPAHLHSGRDAFKSRSVDVVYDDSAFLRWARSSFTALDVRNDKTAQFFDGKHAETGFLEISCIRSSDAHSADQLGLYPTWLQMENVSFSDLKAALELPSRVSRSEPTVPEAYIEGMHIDGVFLKDFWLGLSPYSNVLVGIKGSGKTSILECLRFALGAEVPRERAEEVGKHLNAVLGPSGRVRVLVRRDDGSHVLIERRVADRSFRVWFDDDREVIVPSPVALRFNASILGWHEIEHAATDRQIRRLYLDAIAGREEIKRLTDEASQMALSIRQRHDQASAKYNEFVKLAELVREQEAMRDGLQQLKDANLIALRDEMSTALADREELSRLSTHISSITGHLAARADHVFEIGQFKYSKESPLREVTAVAQLNVGELEEAVAHFVARGEELLRVKGEEFERLHVRGGQKYAEFADRYMEKLNQFAPDVRRLIESHREVLEKTRELPTLKSRLSELRGQVEDDLNELSDICRAVAEKLDERFEVREDRVKHFNVLLREASVVLSVVPGSSRVEEFADTFSQFGPTKEIYNYIRERHSGVGRFHRMVADAYNELRRDLISEDRVVFSRAEFGQLITVLENDDLEIRFAVGKPGEQFSPIDQLSAGQRCTAIFPILLKLRDGPLIIDQPEDNLDNRHIARSVAPVLVEDKRTRQIIMTSHNANLVVLSDPEGIVVFEYSEGTGDVLEAGFLSHRESKVTSHVLDILDGGDRALEMRSKKYGRPLG